jgi:hypothetical protein
MPIMWNVALAHASARFRLLIASSISCVFLKPTVAQSTPAFWKANLIALTVSVQMTPLLTQLI